LGTGGFKRKKETKKREKEFNHRGTEAQRYRKGPARDFLPRMTEFTDEENYSSRKEREDRKGILSYEFEQEAQRVSIDGKTGKGV
jgi:hypothetical protein